jgi:hypothetical protein
MIENVNYHFHDYLKELGCDERLFYRILKLNNIEYHICVTLDYYYQPFNLINAIVFKPVKNVHNSQYMFYVFECSSLKELTKLINRYKKLKVFI